MQPLMYDFCRYAKKVTINKNKENQKVEDWTQLQFIFEKVDPSDFFPNGVKVSNLYLYIIELNSTLSQDDISRVLQGPGT